LKGELRNVGLLDWAKNRYNEVFGKKKIAGVSPKNLEDRIKEDYKVKVSEGGEWRKAWLKADSS